MADDSLNIIYPMDFDRHSVPKGMKPYIPEDLTRDQQMLLDDLKVDNLRNNQRYLEAHPEIRAIVSLIFRMVMKRRPQTAKPNFYEIIAQNFFVDKSSIDLRQEIDEYLAEKQLIYAQKSDLVMFTPSKHHPPSPRKTEEVQIVEEAVVVPYEETDWTVCQRILEDILDSIDYDMEVEHKHASTTSIESDYEIAPEVYYQSQTSLTSVLQELELRSEDAGSTTSSLEDDLELKQMF